MSQITNPPSTAMEPKLDEPVAPVAASTPRSNGLTDEQVKELLAAAGRYKDDPGFIERMLEGVAEYRRQIQEETERDLAAEADAK